MQKAGIIKFNELTELISLQVQNSKKFQSNNAVFLRLNKSEQYILLSKYVDQATNETLIGLNVKTNKFNNGFNVNLSCKSEYVKDKERCNRDVNLHGTYAIIGCFTGPWTCAIGTTLVMIEHKNCMSDAIEDFKDCNN